MGTKRKVNKNQLSIDDLLGPAVTLPVRDQSDIDDLLGAEAPVKPVKVKKTRKVRKSNKKGAMTYEPLEPPEKIEAGGIWAARARKGKQLGRTCLVCPAELKYKGGRPPVICRSAKCFRTYRNLYRRDYDKVRAA